MLILLLHPSLDSCLVFDSLIEVFNRLFNDSSLGIGQVKLTLSRELDIKVLASVSVTEENLMLGQEKTADASDTP